MKKILFGILFSLVGSQSFGAIAFVRLTDKQLSGGNGFNVTIATTDAGNLLICNIDQQENFGHVTSITDNKGNTWIQADGTSDHQLYMWYAANSIAGTTTLTINGNLSSATSWGFSIYEYSGAKKTNPLNVAGHTDNTTGPPKSPMIDSSGTNELFFSNLVSGATTSGVNSPFGNFHSYAAPIGRGFAAYYIDASNTPGLAEQCIYTPGSNINYWSIGAAFLPAATTSAGNPDSMELVF